jgi:hypothetical protein
MSWFPYLNVDFFYISKKAVLDELGYGKCLVAKQLTSKWLTDFSRIVLWRGLIGKLLFVHKKGVV